MSKNYSLITGVTPTGSTQYNTTYTPAKAVDGSTSSYWRPTNADTVRRLTFALSEAVAVDRLRVYLSGSYAPSACVISGSNDGTTYTEITTVAPTKATGWQDFPFTNDTEYLYYQISFPTLYSSYLYLFEIQLYYIVPWTIGDGRQIVIRFTEAITNGIDACPPSSFSVTVPEYDYVPGGTLQNVVKTVKSVSAHPSEPNAIVLTMEDTQRFCNAAGDITVEYTGSGTLTGQGGPVEAFTETFTPTDLVYKGHQNDAEHISLSNMTLNATLTRIYYTDTSSQDMGHIQIASVLPVATLTSINDI